MLLLFLGVVLNRKTAINHRPTRRVSRRKPAAIRASKAARAPCSRWHRPPLCPPDRRWGSATRPAAAANRNHPIWNVQQTWVPSKRWMGSLHVGAAIERPGFYALFAGGRHSHADSALGRLSNVHVSLGKGQFDVVFVKGVLKSPAEPGF